THAPGARPADLADEDFLVRECRLDPLANALDVRGRLARSNREILPIGQDVDRHEIDGSLHLRIAQPELPHIRIGDGHGYPRLYGADQVREVGWRGLASRLG